MLGTKRPAQVISSGPLSQRGMTAVDMLRMKCVFRLKQAA
jgi:hypothetical protein